MERFFKKFTVIGLVGIIMLLPGMACIQPNVSSPPNPVVSMPVLGVAPDRLTFNVPPVPGALSEQTISIINKGTGDLNWVISDNSRWITVQQVAGDNGSQGTDAKVMIDVTGMSPGDYAGIVTIRSEGALNSPVYVPVSLTIYSEGVVSKAPVIKPEQTILPSLSIPAFPVVSSPAVPPSEAVYWKSQNRLYRYASVSACIVSGSIQNMDNLWYMGDVRVVTGSGRTASIADSIPPGEQIIYNRFIPCFGQESVKLSYKWFRP